MLTAIGVLPQVGAGGAQGDLSHPPGQQTPGVRPPDRLWVWRERGGCWGGVRHRSVLMTSVGLELWGGGCPDPMSLGTLSGFLPAGLQRHVPSPCPLPPSEEGLQQRGAEPRRCNGAGLLRALTALTSGRTRGLPSGSHECRWKKTPRPAGGRTPALGVFCQAPWHPPTPEPRQLAGRCGSAEGGVRRPAVLLGTSARPSSPLSSGLAQSLYFKLSSLRPGTSSETFCPVFGRRTEALSRDGAKGAGG